MSDTVKCFLAALSGAVLIEVVIPVCRDERRRRARTATGTATKARTPT